MFYSNSPRFSWTKVFMALSLFLIIKITIFFIIRMSEAPEWYKLLWVDHLRKVKGWSDDQILDWCQRQYSNSLKRVELPIWKWNDNILVLKLIHLDLAEDNIQTLWRWLNCHCNNQTLWKWKIIICWFKMKPLNCKRQYSNFSGLKVKWIKMII